MKHQWLTPSAIYSVIIIWLILAFILFMGDEAIFILPAFFIAVAILFLLIAIFEIHAAIREILSYVAWSLCFALFSYFSAANSATRPFFPILCLFFALNGLILSWRKPSFFIEMQICIWLICFAITFFYGFWPVGIISISISILLSITIHQVSPHLSHLLISGNNPKKNEQPAPSKQNSTQQEKQTPLPTLPSQVPGQQYQPLLPEYDASFGPYIQDLPRE
jgi:hypothetical protein